MSVILLTGFNQFGDLEVNPSELVVARIAARAAAAGADNLVTDVLPTEFSAAGARIIELIQVNEPDVIVMVGASEDSHAISLERVALNLDDAEAPDNAGEQPTGELILPEGPKAYWSTLPLERFQAELECRGIPVVISNHAGAFVCNHIFYLARHAVEATPRPTYCGFVHVPLIAPEESATPGKLAEPVKGLPLDTMVEAIESILTITQKEG